MTRFIKGRDRHRATLFLERLDEAIATESPVRVIHAFIGALDQKRLGSDVDPEATGRPGYHPATLLTIYLYGYLNQVKSSRRLKRECTHNVEMRWLTGQLAPNFETIADFRRDDGLGKSGRHPARSARRTKSERRVDRSGPVNS